MATRSTEKSTPKKTKALPGSPVEQRLAELGTRSAAEPQEARDAAWAWLEELRERQSSDRPGAEAELNELFRLGTATTGLDGPTDGILVTTTTNRLLDPIVELITDHWMPWQGKRFDSASATGDNRMTSSSATQLKLLWPLYSMKEVEEGKVAFDFKTYVEAGKDDPDCQVMVIDYADIEENPDLIIRSIRDELVTLVDGAHLGKILARIPVRNSYALIGFFALRSPV